MIGTKSLLCFYPVQANRGDLLAALASVQVESGLLVGLESLSSVQEQIANCIYVLHKTYHSNQSYHKGGYYFKLS